MKIVLNTQDSELINKFISYSKKLINIEIMPVVVERLFFDHIKIGDIDAYIIDISDYSQKAIDFIKKKYQYVPICIIGENIMNINNGDIYLFKKIELNLLFDIIIKNIVIYIDNFKFLKKLTAKTSDKILFGPSCIYDPMRRTIFYNSKEISKLSQKSGGILEILCSNYGNIVKKDVILEKLWRKSDYFTSRSMDVYVTNIRKIFKENNVPLNIKNFSGIGLVLE